MMRKHQFQHRRRQSTRRMKTRYRELAIRRNLERKRSIGNDKMSVKYKFEITAGTTIFLALSTGLGFAMRFIYDARDYPESQQLMMALIAMTIGILAAILAVSVTTFVTMTVGTHERQNPAVTAKQKFIVWIVRGCALAVIAYFMVMGLAAFARGTFLLIDGFSTLSHEISGRIER
jgi:hypothetical protein